MAETLSIDTPKKKQTGDKARIEELEQKLDVLELTVRMMAHFNGTNRVLDECKIERWEPTQRHLRRERETVKVAKR